MNDSLQVSVVIPVFNEELVLHELYPRLKKEAESWGKSYELLFVDDGSTDNSFELMCKWKKKDSKIRIVKFTRNFGQQAAVLAGFRKSRGDIVVQIDSDLQNPPEEIKRLLSAFTDEIDLVVTIPHKRPLAIEPPTYPTVNSMSLKGAINISTILPCDFA